MQSSEVKTPVSRYLVMYGSYLLVAGLAGYLSNPEKAKTALVSGGTFAVLSFLFAFFAKQGKGWAKPGAAAMLVFLTGIFSWRSWAGFSAVMAGNEEKLFAACLISSMLLASVLCLFALYRKAPSGS